MEPMLEDRVSRFTIELIQHDLIQIYNCVQGFNAHLHLLLAQSTEFAIERWYAERCANNSEWPLLWEVAQQWEACCIERNQDPGEEQMDQQEQLDGLGVLMDLNGVQVDHNKYLSLQQNSAWVKGNHRILLKPIVVLVWINGHPARALLDSGLLRDFLSSMLVDQLSIKKENLDSLLLLQLAVQGSRSKVNVKAAVKLEYQGICETRTFDIININNYDLILGTPWMYQHQICLGFNLERVVVRSDSVLAIKEVFPLTHQI